MFYPFLSDTKLMQLNAANGSLSCCELVDENEQKVEIFELELM